MQEILYFDDQAIRSLAAQLPGGSVKSIVAELEKASERTGGLKGRFGLGSLMQLLGIASLEGEAEIGKLDRLGRKHIVSYEHTPEGSYQAIVAALSGERALHRSFDAARLARQASGSSSYCDISDTFVPEGWAENDSEAAWLDAANRDGRLVLTSLSDPNVRTTMSLDKMRAVDGGRLSHSGHLALRVRANGGLRMQVFGVFDVNYIKPFVASYL